MSKTMAISIVAVQHEGGLLSRFVAEDGVLPGTTIMVPAGCYCILIAGDKATAVFDVGPHDLDLMQFNRQPAGLLFTVGREPEAITWYPKGSPFRRVMTVQVNNPLKFVEELVLRRAAEDHESVGRLMTPHIDALIPAGQIVAAPDASMQTLAKSLVPIGLKLIDLKEESAVAPEIQPGGAAPQASPPASAPPASAPPPSAPPAAAPPHAPPSAPPVGADPALAPTLGAGAASPVAPPPSAPPPSAPPPGGDPAHAPTLGAGAAPPVSAPPPSAPPSAPPVAPPPSAPPPSAPPPGADPALAPTLGVDSAQPVAAVQGPSLRITHVWASSTMDLFGKGELTLRIRLLGRTEEKFNPAGPFAYDCTKEYLSPDDWLAEKVYQALPEDSLHFAGLQPTLFYRVFVVAEERDKKSTDALGNLDFELGRPTAREFELGPTQGGKRNQYVKLRARFE